MRAFASVLTNDFHRALEYKSKIFLFLVLIVGGVAAALFFNSQNDIVANIAWVTADNDLTISSPYLTITTLENKPLLSEMVMGKFDAVVFKNSSGEFEVQTVKRKELEQRIMQILQDPLSPAPDISVQRGIGTNIIGFLTMFIMMQGVTLMFLFAEDKERKQLKRIAASPISFTGYMSAHSVFVFIFMTIPTLIVIYSIRFIFGVDIGFQFGQYLLLISLISLIATTFSLMLNAIITKADSANMMGSALVILTSVLAGSFYSFEAENRILETVIRILPQRSYLALANGLENGSGMLFSHLVYVISLIVLFFFIGVTKSTNDYVNAN